MSSLAKRLTSIICFKPALFALLCTSALPAQAGTYQSVYAFPHVRRGLGPEGSLIAFGKRLFGTTADGGTTSGGGNAGFGTVFSLNSSAVESLVHSFQGSDGVNPSAGLTAVGNTLYGTTKSGGAYGRGTVFALNPTTGAITVLHSFKGAPDGDNPVAGLINVNGTLYGTTYYGGLTDCSFGCGTVFSFNLGTDAEKIVYSFRGEPDGENPTAGLLNVGGTLYGTTSGGGAAIQFGTVFALNPATRSETVLYSFRNAADGGYPAARLINVDGVLYGTATSGGTAMSGVVFSLNLATDVETAVYAFHGGNDGADPQAGLIDVGGVLYGTTYRGGSANDGTVFSLNLATSAEKVEHSFLGSSSDGALPDTDLIDAGGTLYGATVFGGPSTCGNPDSGCGTVFAFTP